MNKRFTILLLLVSMVAQWARSAETSYSVDQQGNVVFASTIENLPLSAEEIHRAAISYIEEAYKHCSFNIVDNNVQKYSVSGTGEFSGIHTQGGIVNSQIYSAKIRISIDAKDGRARVRVIARNYDVKSLSDVGTRSEEQLLVSQCEPVGNVYTSKGFKKAFTLLSEKIDKVLAEATDAIKNTMPSASESSDW